MTYKTITALLVGVMATYSAVSVAQSANYPSSPIKIIVPYQAGGSTDTVVREFAQIVAPKLGTAIVIENKGGAGATMGARELARARPDGYTLAILPSPVFRLPHIQDAGYDPLKDFTYINMLSGYTLGVAVKADSAYKTWEDFIAAAKAQPEKITYGTASVGSASNVMMEQIAGHYGIKWTHVPYQGETGVIQAVMGDFVNAYAGSSTVLPMVESGKMRMLVTWGETRSAIYPDTPTLHELNPAMPPVYAPFGIAAPKGTPDAVVEKLAAVFKEVVESPEFSVMLRKYGQEPVYMDSAEYAAYAKKAFAEEAEVVKQLGLRSN